MLLDQVKRHGALRAADEERPSTWPAPYHRLEDLEPKRWLVQSTTLTSSR